MLLLLQGYEEEGKYQKMMGKDGGYIHVVICESWEVEREREGRGERGKGERERKPREGGESDLGMRIVV